MANNTTLPAGAGGDTIADEDIAGVKYQQVKLIDPTAGSTTPIGTVANPINVTNASLPLPTGASTAIRQDTGNTSLSSIDGKTPSLGQQVAAASSPVVLTAAQLATLTPLSTVAVTQSVANWTQNVAQWGGSNVVSAATGVPKVGASDSLGQVQYNFPAGFVRTTDEPRQLFYDPFDTFDTTNRWNQLNSGAVGASVSSGVLTLGSGTGTGFSYLESKPSFTPTIPGWLSVSFAISLENPLTTGAVRFWGCGTTPASPTAAAPITDGYGFELTTTGTLECVVYASGVRTSIATITGSLTDALSHRYIINYRTDRIFFFFDSLATPVATASFQGPNIQTLPVKIQVVGNNAASSRGISCVGLAVADSAKNNTTISDGTFGWRKLTVNPDGSALVSSANAAKETSGNLETITQLLESQRMQVALLRAIHMQLALMNGGSSLNETEFLNDSLIH